MLKITIEGSQASGKTALAGVIASILWEHKIKAEFKSDGGDNIMERSVKQDFDILKSRCIDGQVIQIFEKQV